MTLDGIKFGEQFKAFEAAENANRNLSGAARARLYGQAAVNMQNSVQVFNPVTGKVETVLASQVQPLFNVNKFNEEVGIGRARSYQQVQKYAQEYEQLLNERGGALRQPPKVKGTGMVTAFDSTKGKWVSCTPEEARAHKRVARRAAQQAEKAARKGFKGNITVKGLDGAWNSQAADGVMKNLGKQTISVPTGNVPYAPKTVSFNPSELKLDVGALKKPKIGAKGWIGIGLAVVALGVAIYAGVKHLKNKKAEAEAQAIAEQEAQPRAEQEAQAKAVQEAQARAEQEAQARAEQEAQARAEQEAQARAEQEAQAKAEAEAQAKAEQEAQAKAEQEAQAKAEQEAKAKAEAEAQAKAEQEAQAKAEQEAQAKAEQEAKAKAEQEAKAKAEQEAQAKAEQEAQAKAEQEAQAKAEQEAQAKAELEAQAKAEAEAKAKAELERLENEKGMTIPEINGEIAENRSENRAYRQEIRQNNRYGTRIPEEGHLSNPELRTKIQENKAENKELRQDRSELRQAERRVAQTERKAQRDIARAERQADKAERDLRRQDRKAAKSGQDSNYEAQLQEIQRQEQLQIEAIRMASGQAIFDIKQSVLA